jgi:hypothetical protein
MTRTEADLLMDVIERRERSLRHGTFKTEAVLRAEQRVDLAREALEAGEREVARRIALGESSTLAAIESGIDALRLEHIGARNALAELLGQGRRVRESVQQAAGRGQ